MPIPKNLCNRLIIKAKDLPNKKIQGKWSIITGEHGYILFNSGGSFVCRMYQHYNPMEIICHQHKTPGKIKTGVLTYLLNDIKLNRIGKPVDPGDWIYSACVGAENLNQANRNYNNLIEVCKAIKAEVELKPWRDDE